MITRLLINGRYARLIDTGPANAPVLLMLHGFASDASAWDRIAERFTPEFRVIAIDLPGHGAESDARGTACSMQTATARIAHILSRLAINRVSLVGYSMGGRLALNFALTNPETVERMCLISASPGIADEAERRARRSDDDVLAAQIQTEGIEAFADKWQAKPLFAHLERNDPRSYQEIREMRLACSPDGLAASLRGMGTGMQPYLGDRLGELIVPTLLVSGEHDLKFTKIAHMMHDLFTAERSNKNSVRLTIIADAGHTVHAEKTDQFVETLRGFMTEPTQATQE